MEKKIICIGREYGSGGHDLGEALAKRLGFDFYDNEIIDTPDLHIPHIDMENRDFVLKPLDEIAPYYRHPVLNKTIHQLLTELNSKSN